MRDKCKKCGRIVGQKAHICPDHAWNKGLKKTQRANSGSFKKGHQINLGKKIPHTEEWKQKMRGRKLSEETKNKIKESNIGKHNYLTLIRKPSGKNHHWWKGGITPINLAIRMSTEYKLWREQVFERDDYTCQICGIRGRSLRANHIKKFSDYINLRLIVKNGITICEDCDNKYVLRHEEKWESYFNFNLITRNFLLDEQLSINLII